LKITVNVEGFGIPLDGHQLARLQERVLTTALRQSPTQSIDQDLGADDASVLKRRRRRARFERPSD
jgi:hypothetical protein